jgi:hypothetical protein
MKTVGVLAAIFGAACMAVGVLGASVPFSFPWENVGAGFMALAFAVSVASFVIGMAVLRSGIEVIQGRSGGVGRLARATRPVAGLVLAVGLVVAFRVVQVGARPMGRWMGAVAVAAVAGAAAALGLGRALGRRGPDKA